MTFIYDAVRTPRGRGVPAGSAKAGSLSTLSPQDLVAGLVSAIAKRASRAEPIEPGLLMLSCVGQVGAQGGHIALVSKLASDLPDACAALTVNNYCAGGLSAINLAGAWSSTQKQRLVLAGGVEMLSRVLFVSECSEIYTDRAVRESMGWMPAPMGSELIAALDGFSRSDLDEVSLRSHRRAVAAWQREGFGASVIPVANRAGDVMLDTDECVRANLNAEQLASLPPLFPNDESTHSAKAQMHARYPELSSIEFVHTVGHVPPQADGAALALLGSRSAGVDAGLSPRAEILASAELGGDSILQFGAGFAAMEAVLADTGMQLSDIDRIEFMEAFAATPLRFERQYRPDMERVNVNGGHLAMGHPMGATGAVLVSSLLDELEQSDGEIGMVVTLGATGVGSAIIVRRLKNQGLED